jgi:ABC-2 type transport system ATP-binding protein/lipopolysaccharide transport system ATP-binding protein
VLVELDHVWKRYLLGQRRGAARVLLEAVGLRRNGSSEAWALQDATVRLRRGESLGIVGRNGAGKTTLLRLIAGITRPTRGSVTTEGRVASLLNVGAGFHPELTGSENVFLNGVILGLRRAEVSARYEQIVDFAGLEPFMDTPVKRYSSGMYARLAFAVAAHSDPDVLLVDEVLSVGDATFQDRSLRRMLEFRDEGRAAVVFVSHNLAAVELMCQQAIWLDRGHLRAHGPTADVIRAYLDAVDDDAGTVGDAYIAIEDVLVEPAAVDPNEPFRVRVVGRALQELLEPVFVITIRGDHGPLFAGNMHIDGNWPARIPLGPFVVECDFGSAVLTPGRYGIEVKVKQNVRTNYYEPRIKAHLTVRGVAALSHEGGDVTATWRARCLTREASAMMGRD